MDDLETFKATREKMDPTSRKMSDRQWERAYAAYCSSRERVGRNNTPTKSNKRRQAPRAVASGAYRASELSGASALRHTVREQSAYRDLRLIVDIMAWVVVLLIAVAEFISIYFFATVPSAIFIGLFWLAVKVIFVFMLCRLMQVLIDIPDIALYRSLQNEASKEELTLAKEM